MIEVYSAYHLKQKTHRNLSDFRIAILSLICRKEDVAYLDLFLFVYYMRI